MDEFNNPPKTEENEKPKMPVITTGNNKKKGMGNLLTIILALLLVAALAFLAWYWMQAETDKKNLNAEKAALQSQLDTLKAQNAQEDQAEADTPCSNTPSASRKENIKAALDSKNTAAFSTYTSDPVNYILAASELGKDMTPTEAATALEYTHSATGPWDFNLPAATINAWKAGFYKDHFDDANRYIGKSASGMVVSFDFDCNGKISKIFVAASEDLLL